MLASGNVTCWGNNTFGQLGDGTSLEANYTARPLNTRPPVDLGGLSAAAVAVGSLHSCALLDDGGVKCWGAGPHCEHGYPSAEDSNLLAPPLESLGANATAIAIIVAFSEGMPFKVEENIAKTRRR